MDIDKILQTDHTLTTITVSCIEFPPSSRRYKSIVESSDSPFSSALIEKAQQIYNLFCERSDHLVSDGTVEENGTVHVSAATGATLTSEKVLNDLKNREQRRIYQKQKLS